MNTLSNFFFLAHPLQSLSDIETGILYFKLSEKYIK